MEEHLKESSSDDDSDNEKQKLRYLIAFKGA